MRKTKVFTPALGTGADQPLVFDVNGPQAYIKAVNGFNKFVIKTLAGSVRVKGSMEGEGDPPTWDQQIVMAEEPGISGDVPGAQAGQLVGKTTADVLAHFSGDWRALRIEQVGATPASIKLFVAADE